MQYNIYEELTIDFVILPGMLCLIIQLRPSAILLLECT